MTSIYGSGYVADMPNQLPLPKAYFGYYAEPMYSAVQMRKYAVEVSAADNAALHERIQKMSDTMKGMEAHEAGLAEAQAYLMDRVQNLEAALRTVETLRQLGGMTRGAHEVVQTVVKAALEAKP